MLFLNTYFYQFLGDFHNFSPNIRYCFLCFINLNFPLQILNLHKNGCKRPSSQLQIDRWLLEWLDWKNLHAEDKLTSSSELLSTISLLSSFSLAFLPNWKVILFWKQNKSSSSSLLLTLFGMSKQSKAGMICSAINLRSRHKICANTGSVFYYFSLHCVILHLASLGTPHTATPEIPTVINFYPSNLRSEFQSDVKRGRPY